MFIFGEIAKNLKSGKNVVQTILNKIFDEYAVQRYMITLIQDRIYDDGEDAFNSKLRTNASFRPSNQSEVYSDLTVDIKKEKGQKYQNVTLRDSETFYRSFIIKSYKKFLRISAKFDKSDENIYDNFDLSYNSFNEFEAAILDLTEEEWEQLKNKVLIPKFIDYYVQMFTS